MDAAEIEPGSLAEIYREKVRPQRTRAIRIDVPPRENVADIQYTLLGIEVKVGGKRFPCPDLATARYIRVFARIGCSEFAIPYDITKISTLADELETAWHRALLQDQARVSGKTPRAVKLARSRLIKSIRNEIMAVGPGDAMPAFDRPTRTRQ